MTFRSRDVYRPVASAVDIRGAAFFEGLVGARFQPVLIVGLAFRRQHGLLEDIVEAFILEISLVLSDPLLQAKVRLDDEFLVLHEILSSI